MLTLPSPLTSPSVTLETVSVPPFAVPQILAVDGSVRLLIVIPIAPLPSDVAVMLRTANCMFDPGPLPFASNPVMFAWPGVLMLDAETYPSAPGSTLSHVASDAGHVTNTPYAAIMFAEDVIFTLIVNAPTPVLIDAGLMATVALPEHAGVFVTGVAVGTVVFVTGVAVGVAVFVTGVAVGPGVTVPVASHSFLISVSFLESVPDQVPHPPVLEIGSYGVVKIPYVSLDSGLIDQ